MAMAMCATVKPCLFSLWTWAGFYPSQLNPKPCLSCMCHVRWPPGSCRSPLQRWEPPSLAPLVCWNCFLGKDAMSQIDPWEAHTHKSVWLHAILIQSEMQQDSNSNRNSKRQGKWVFFSFVLAEIGWPWLTWLFHSLLGQSIFPRGRHLWQRIGRRTFHLGMFVVVGQTW